MSLLQCGRKVKPGKRRKGMNKTLPSQNGSKTPYERPQVVRVSLRPEEAVLGHCKIPGHAGPASAGCRSVIACRTQGS